MKRITIILGVVALAPAWGASPGQKVDLARTYHVGDKDVYAVTNTIGAQASVKASFTLTQVVVKTYPDGDADLRSTMTDMKIVIGGKSNSPTTKFPDEVHRVNALGAPSGSRAGHGQSAFQTAFLGLNAAKGGMKVGQSLKFDMDAPELPGLRESGVLKLEKLDGAVATISAETDLKSTDAGAGGEALAGHMVETFVVDTALGKLDHLKMSFTPAVEAGSQAYELAMDRVGAPAG